MKRFVIVAVLFVAVYYYKGNYGSVVLGPGVLAPLDPVQVEIVNPTPFQFRAARVKPLASFTIMAKVLGIEWYSHDSSSEFSPVDFALGWGRMSDESVTNEIDISQSNRWYRWHTSNFPIPRREIETHSANMHLIPADEAVELALEEVREGQIVELKGKLIELKKPDGWYWKSSLLRSDKGARACEVIFVEEVSIVDKRVD